MYFFIQEKGNFKLKYILFFLERKRKDAVVAASTLTSALVDHLNVG